jgi:hypothetical protein
MTIHEVHLTTDTATPAELPEAPKRGRGRPKTIINNPFYGHLDPTDKYDDLLGRYPPWAMNVVEGIARLEWYDPPRAKSPMGISGAVELTDPSYQHAKPLSVSSIMCLLAALPVVTTEAVMEALQRKKRQAQRYVKALSMIIPRLMQCRPREVIAEMSGEVLPGKPWMDWEDLDTTPPDPEALAKLHHDLRTFPAQATPKPAEEAAPDTEPDLKWPNRNYFATGVQAPDSLGCD